MICKGKSVVHTLNAIAYGLGKPQAEELCREGLAGENAHEIAQEMALIQQQNSRCTNNLLRIELSPTIEDGKRLAHDEWEALVRDFMVRMQLHDNRPWICVLHNDREHKHAHIYASRINFDGEAYNDSHFTLRCGKVAEQIAQERGLKTAMAVHREKQQALEPLRKQILAAHRAISRPGLSPSQYLSLMQKQGIAVVFNQSTTGRITGMSFCVGDTKIKASEVARNMSYNKLFGVQRETSKLVNVTPRQLLTRTRPSADSILPSGSISIQLAKMFGRGMVQYAKPDEKEKEEQELTL